MYAAVVQWAGHAGLLWELHEQELSRLSDDRREKNRQHARTLAVLTKQLAEEREHGGAAAAQERDAAAAQLRAAQEVRASVPEMYACFSRSTPEIHVCVFRSIFLGAERREVERCLR